MQQYFNNEILLKTTEEKKDIMNKIIKEKENKIKENHFWYYNSSPNVCTFIHKRGKKQGFMCHKKIRTNLNGEKADFLCSTHSKLHIPKNKKIKNVIIKKCEYKEKEM
jgi:hypothetical protein